MASVVQVERLTLNKSNTEYAEEQEGSKDVQRCTYVGGYLSW